MSDIQPELVDRMGLRDWFAGQALSGLLSSEWRGPTWYRRDGNGTTWQAQAAVDAYALADALLLARTAAPRSLRNIGEE